MQILRTLFLLLFLLFHTQAKELQLTHEELNFIKENPTIRVQNESSWAPIDFRENGREKGYAVDYIKLLGEKAGFKIEFISGRSWSSYLQMLQDKKIDLISSMKKTPKRQNYALFSEYPITELFNSVLQKKGSKPLTSRDDLKDKTVAVVKGYYQEEILRLHFPHLKLKLANDTLDAMRLVANGEADVTIEYDCVLKYNISRHFITDVHAIPIREERHFTPASQYIGVRDDWPLLKSIIDKAMRSVSEKEVHELRLKWLGGIQEKYPKLNKEEQLYIKDKESISFCSDPDWLPIEKIEGNKHIGISADYIKEISKRLNLQFKLVPTTSWQESLSLVSQNKCDFLSSAARTPEREEFLNFSTAYLDLSLVITTRSDTFFIHSLKSIKDKKIGVVQGYAFEHILRRDYPNVELVSVPNAYKGLRKVESGEIYAFIDTLEATSEQLRTNSFADLKISGKLEENIALSFGIKKENHILFDILEKGINSLTNEEKKSIYDKWVYVAVEKEIDYTLFFQLLAGAVLVVLFLVYRNRVALNYNSQLLNINKELEHLNVQLEELSQTDQLTQLSNRRYLDMALSQEITRSYRYKESFCVILMDIDFFKKVNDTYGHQQGDSVLKDTANILRSYSRQVDIVGRWGGEEFLIILPQTDLHNALIMTEKLREMIKAHDYKLEYQLTASFGVTEFNQTDDDESSLLKRVDANLYEAKETGRDKIISS